MHTKIIVSSGDTIPVIFLTGNSDASARWQAKERLIITSMVSRNCSCPECAHVICLFQGKDTPIQTAGVRVSLVGALTIIVRGDLNVLQSMSLHQVDVLIFIAVVFYAAYSVILRKRPPIYPLSFASGADRMATIRTSARETIKRSMI